MTALLDPNDPRLTPSLTAFSNPVDPMDLARLSEFHQARLAPKSWEARKSDLHQYLVWCQHHGIAAKAPTPADLCLWLAHMATDGRWNRLHYDPRTRRSTLFQGAALSIRSIRRRYSSLLWFLDSLDSDQAGTNPARDPLVSQQLAGISRVLPSKPRRAPGLTSTSLPGVIAAIQGQDFVARRDRLILSLGFAGALRIGDLAALQLEDVQIHPQGLVLGFEQRKRKNQFSQISVVAGQDPNCCPIVLLQAYLADLGAYTGPLFRRANRNRRPLPKPLHPQSIARIIERRGAGFLTRQGRFTGHSLRRGFIDSALAKGAPISEVMKISGHQDPKTLMLYLDDLGHFQQHPGQGLY